MADERGRDARPYVILITDGYPDDDYRSFGCDCQKTRDPMSTDFCGGGSNVPSKMHCPYPMPEEAAHELACGQGRSCDAGPSERVYVVGYAIDDSDVADRLDAIAAAGGTDKRATRAAPNRCAASSAPSSTRSSLRTDASRA